jgi:hypothetical protein
MAQLSENDIIHIVYAMKEGDDDGWETASDEYLAARRYCNVAINIWEFYESTIWRELWSTLTAAADGTKTTTAGTYSYACPTNFVRAGSWVRINGELFSIVVPERVASLTESDSNFVYFTGSIKDGFSLKINPRLTLKTGNVIEYEYYKTATKFTTTTSTTELSDPYFIVYFVLARFLKNDGEDFGDERDMYENKLELMQTTNISGYFGISDPLSETLETQGGFGD